MGRSVGQDLLGLVQEQADMRHESIRILIHRSMAGIRVDDQLSIGKVLLKIVRVDRVKDRIVASGHHEDRLRDRFQVGV